MNDEKLNLANSLNCEIEKKISKLEKIKDMRRQMCGEYKSDNSVHTRSHTLYVDISTLKIALLIECEKTENELSELKKQYQEL